MARLRRVSDKDPGLSRVPKGRGFSYQNPDGSVCNEATRERCEGLGIPPAWRDVWICQDENGHIQATGYDEKGRKQYRYHPDWRSAREADKFDRLTDFAAVLPKIRRAARKALEAPPGSADFALGALVLLLDQVPMRIGSRAYLESNGTIGATTLTSRNITWSQDTMRLHYRAKGGKRVQRTIRSKRLQSLLQEAERIPGDTIFSYVGREGEPASVTAEGFNAYLDDITGQAGLTAKTFRTWSGTVTALETAIKAMDHDEPLSIKMMAQAASERLANTPAIARNSYVHPDVIELSTSKPHRARLCEIITGVQSVSGLRKHETILKSYLDD